MSTLRIPLRRRRQLGISLMEMMVGITIGLVCVLIIVQLLSVWEGRKRTTSSGNDAQTIGTIGSFSLDRDLRLAGYGFGTAPFSMMGCSVVASNSSLTAPSVNFPLTPVDITKGATEDKPDTVRVLYGNSPYFVGAQLLNKSTAESKTLEKSRDGFLVGDKVVVASDKSADCQLVEITGLALSDAVTVEHESGKTYTTVTGISRTASMNPAGGTGTTFSTGSMFNLGQGPAQQIWTVDTGRQMLTRYNRLGEDPSKAVDVASDVVTLKAQYGVDNNGNGIVESTEWADTVAFADRVKVRAVRFALLVRSRQFERPNGTTPVTAAAPTWADGGKAFVLNNVDGTTDSGSGASAITGATASNNWRNYRYRVYENVVPLRNMIWGTAP
ncbi:PilW family protein [Variovorax sp. J22R24]|uniref:PilW family protein n=1 Tax=Variovorax gracilis TaxID=3053502 RepID=UPI002574FBB2|nr:PilW family protein [Variovorax sp. J22R24]MDM0106021.1 PilW family protein [Variovorax sp. J22R24]